MFSSILFLFFIMLMSVAVPMDDSYGILSSPSTSAFAGLALITATLALIALEKKVFSRTSKKRLVTLFHMQLIASLVIARFYLAFLKPLNDLPLIFPITATVALYLIGVGWIQFLYGGMPDASRAVRFLFPMALPFLILAGVSEIPLFQTESTTTLAILGSLFALATALLFPRVLQAIWSCKPLTSSPLKDQLESLCTRLGFRHDGLKVWTILNDGYTAAIVGVVPACRYIMFTPKLLRRFKNEHLEAILAHEIGHSKHKHLLYYPLILGGVAIICSWFFTLFIAPIAHLFSDLRASYPGHYWEETFSLTLFCLFALLLTASLRWIFGIFSRLFERQADLYVFDAGIDAKHMIAALKELSHVTGQRLDEPNWHHHSLQERISFIEQASRSPLTIASHHKKVRRVLNTYFLLVIVAIFAIIFLSNS